jgi:DNA-binding Lrp family transcriptional regulator
MYFDIAQMTCDLDCRRILSSIDTKPRSAKEIARLCHLSLSRCYRMIKDMEQNRILRRADVDGREISYISNLRSIELALEDDHLYLTVEYRDGTRTDVELGPQDLQRAETHFLTTF